MVVLGLTAATFVWTVWTTAPPIDPNSLQTLEEFKRFASTHPVSEVSGTPSVFHEYARSRPIDQAFLELLKVKQRGLDRGLTREDEMYTRSIAMYRLWCGILAGVGAVGIGLIACGILARLGSPRS
jgi:hypothetical protein